MPVFIKKIKQRIGFVKVQTDCLSPFLIGYWMPTSKCCFCVSLLHLSIKISGFAAFCNSPLVSRKHYTVTLIFDKSRVVQCFRCVCSSYVRVQSCLNPQRTYHKIHLNAAQCLSISSFTFNTSFWSSSDTPLLMNTKETFYQPVIFYITHFCCDLIWKKDRLW